MPKRVLMMYISEISGHRSASLAVEAALKTVDPCCDVLNINAFGYTNPLTERIVNKIYMFVIQNTPGIWDYLYDRPSIVRGTKRMREAINKIDSNKLQSLIDKFQPDAIGCTQAFPCGLIADMKKKHDLKIPLYAIVTDFVPHSFWIYENIDFYSVACDMAKEKLIKNGVAPDKIKVFGIPIDPKFSKGSAQKNKTFIELGFEPSKPVILIMGGGQGLGPIVNIVKSLEHLKYGLQVIVVCGINENLYKNLDAIKYRLKNNVKIFGFVNNIDELMGISTLIISKPGGITVAESLAKTLPLVIASPLPGQEAKNTQFLLDVGVAINARNESCVVRAIEELLSQPERLSQMKRRIEQVAKPNSSIDIARLMLS